MRQRMLVRLSLMSLLGLFALGCDEPETCKFLNDCPSANQECQNGVCVVLDINRGDGGVILPTGDAGPGNDAGPRPVQTIDEQQLQSRQTISWLERDPLNPNNTIFPEYENGSFDVLRTFGVATGVLLPNIADFDIDFAGCNLDSFSVQTVSGRQEHWFNCQLGQPLRIAYAADFTDLYELPGPSTELVYAVTGLDGNNPRRLVTARAGTSLTSWEILAADAPFSERLTDDFDPALTFGSITQFLDVDPDGAGNDHVIVVGQDATGLKLTPMFLEGDRWSPNPNMVPYTLPVGAHAVVQLGQINASGNSENGQIANFAAIFPQEGRIRFYNFENRFEVDAPGTLFEADNGFQAEAPLARARMLIEKTPAGDSIMYANQNARRVWKIPLRPGAENDVRAYELDPLERRVSGLVVATDDEVWLTYGTDSFGPAIERVPVRGTP